MFACVAVLSFTKRVKKKEKTNRARGGVSPSRSIYYSMCDEPPLKIFIFFDSQTKLFFALHSLQRKRMSRSSLLLKHSRPLQRT